ncbi:MAG: hypothetical protein LBT38_00400, partial [Deltaproteobacteria bacterium]|nr:hypothetical protein [Deltaproteobacteria bacterium]
MIYRTSQRGTYRAINGNLDLLSYRIAQLSNKIASEKSVNKPSDNPSGAATILRTRTTLSQIAQHTDNINYANTWLTNTGNVMDSIKGALDEIYAKAEQGATDTYSAEQKKIIGTEIDVLFQSIVQFADSKFGDNYLLSGQQVGTQPFGLSLRAQGIVAGCDNSDLWTGTVKTASSLYNPRPDLAVQSEKYLVEVVQAGGIDSSLFANQSQLATLKILGQNTRGEYGLTLTAQSPEYNQTQIRIVAGPTDEKATGTLAADNLITFYASSSQTPATKIVYDYGPDSATPVTAAYSAGANTITVYLQPNQDPPQGSSSYSLSSAFQVVSAINALSAQTLVTAAGSGLGLVDLKKDELGQPQRNIINFHPPIEVTVNGSQITVYVPANASGEITATVSAVVSALNSDPAASKMVAAAAYNITIPSPYYPTPVNGAINLSTSFQTLVASDPYTLASIEAETPGTHNDIIFSVKNEPGAPLGSAGNDYEVIYKYSLDPTQTTTTTASYNSATHSITVSIGNNGPVYVAAYAQYYADPKSPAFLNAAEADRLARLSARTGTALEVVNAVNGLSQNANLANIPHIEAKLAEGESGLGKVSPGGPFQLQGGYSQAALFRVSQDGGLTWGPPQAFTPSQYANGQLFYNSQLGHASLTTNLPGGANDLVFTANYQGTWGDDLRVEYKEPQPGTPNAPLSVTLGPNSWNICVNLATNSAGQVITTANDVMKAINNHPEASQLVTVGLANYHEGGLGIVKGMDCLSLVTGEPYEVANQTQITPLGHA